MSPGTRWIAGVITTLVGGVVAMVILIVFAERATAGRIVPDYYQRAAHYDDDIAAADASRQLNWRTTVAITRTDATVCVRTSAGVAVPATIELRATHRRHPGSPVVGRGTVEPDGCARLALALAPGIHDVAITADLARSRYVATATREVR
jgi:nitrogen fixation protein FixH